MNNLQLGYFVQDTKGIHLEDGTEYPPDFHWHSNITAQDDQGNNFYVKVRIPPGQAGNINAVAFHINIALFTLEEECCTAPKS